MKYILLLFTLMPCFASAQFAKGDKFVGGGVGLRLQRTPVYQNNEMFDKSTNFYLRPQIGFFINEKIAVGGVLEYSRYSSKTPTTQGVYTVSNNAYSVGALARRYYKISEKFLFALSGMTTYNINVSKDSNTSSKNKYHSLSIGAQPLFVFFPSAHWAFEAGVGYIGYQHSKGSSTNKTDVFNLDFGSVSLGLTYYFTRSE